MIPFDVLARLALGDLDTGDEAAAEEHVLSCTQCARVLERLVMAGVAVRALLACGGSQVFVTSALVERLDAAALITRRYALSPGSIVPCAVDANDVYELTTLAADLEEATRVDVELGGQRHVDVPFERERGTVSLLASGEWLRALPSRKIPIRAIAVGEAGSERVLAEYVLDHTAFGG